MKKHLIRRIALSAVLALAATTTVISPAGAAEPSPGWSATAGTGDAVRYYDLADAPDGTVVLAGWDQNGSETDGVVRKLNDSGAEVWKTIIGTDGAADFINGVDVAPDGSVFVAGQTRGDLAGRSGGTDFDGFVTKLSPAGVVLWTRQFGTNGVNQEDAALAVAADDDGSVFVGASFATGSGSVVLRFDGSGTERWRFLYGELADRIEDMAMGGDGSAYFSGTNSLRGDAFVISASAAGTMSSTTRVAGISQLRLDAAPGGDIVAGGDGYLVRFGSFGLARWAETRDLGFDIRDVAAESDGSILAFGETSGATADLRGFDEGGSLESWTKALPAAGLFGRVVATTGGGVVTSSTKFPATALLQAFTGSSNGSGGVAGFTDVAPGLYYSDAVVWLKDQGVTTGTSPTTYSPEDVVTRAQMAAFLHRLAGSPSSTAAHGFSDVPGGAFYAGAVGWLSDQGITTGTSPTTYSPEDVVTRAQMAAFLHRLAGSPSSSGPHGFVDVPGGAFYAGAVGWLKEQGITTGSSPTTYSPSDPVTRAQMAAFMFRMATDSDWDHPGS